MTQSVARGAALLACLISLVACDSGGPDDEVVGTWTLAAYTTRDVATVSRTQAVLDANARPDGAATIEGDQTGSVSHLNWVSRYGGALEFSLLSYDPDGPAPVDQQIVTVTDGAAYPGERPKNLQVTTYGPDAPGYFPLASDADPFTRSGWSFRFRDVALGQSDGSGRSVRVGGAVVLGSRELVAGTPTALTEYAGGADPSYTLVYEFEVGGTLRVRVSHGNRTVETLGMWERDGARLRLTAPYGDYGASETVSYVASRSGGDLVLIDDAAGSSCDRSCRQSMEEAWGMEAGSLERYQTEVEVRFRPSAARASARATGLRAGPMPSVVRDALLLRPGAR